MATPAPAVRRNWLRNYPPLLVILGAFVIVLAVLPSALNLPQSNPSQTLEYAPVPPQDENPPPLGNFASLGLGSSASLQTGTTEQQPPSIEAAGRLVKPTTKRCVGNPPRQTEDPLSPPCVGYFAGDNFGATYQGVTREEIRILVYVDGLYNDVGTRGEIYRPPGTYYDLAKPPTSDENYHVSAVRIWQRYFNERYQTYGRFAHFYVYFSKGTTPEDRRGDAADNYARIKPFAVIVQDYPYSGGVPYVELMARRGVLTFGLIEERPEEVFRRFPKLEWGYQPTVEYHAKQFADFICNKVIPYKTSFGGNDADPDQRLHNGQPRRLGLLYTTDPEHETKRTFMRVAKKQIEACGGKFVSTGTYPSAGFICCAPENNQAAADNAARFKTDGVTTVIHMQGYSPEQSQGFGKVGYYPEWIVGGDLQMEDIVQMKYEDQQVWSHAWVISNVTLDPARRTQLCYLAAKEADPNLALLDSSIPCRFYNDMRQLFTGIQVAGPRLGPTSIDRGYHAIPAVPSTNPQVPACFYDPGGYTCVHDSIAMWWDSQKTSTFSGQPGCWRVPLAGKRFLVGTWPKGDIATLKDTARDPCNGYTRGAALDPSPGSDSPPPQ